MAINITDGFYLGRPTPIDTRIVAKNSSQRTSIKHKYDGLRVFQTDTRESWVWNSPSKTWELEETGISGLVGNTGYLTKITGTNSLTASNIYIDASKGYVGISPYGVTSPLSPTSILQLSGSNSNSPINIYNDSTIGAGFSYNWKYDSGNSVHGLTQGSLKLNFDGSTSHFVASVRNAGDLAVRYNDIFELNKTTQGGKWNIIKTPGTGNFVNGKVVFDNQTFGVGVPIVTYKKPQHVYIDGPLRTNSAKYESVTWLTYDGSNIISQYGINRQNSSIPSTSVSGSSTYKLRQRDENLIIDSTTKATMYINLGSLGDNTDHIGRCVNISYQSSNSIIGSKAIIQSTNDIVDMTGNVTDVVLHSGESINMISFVSGRNIKWKILNKRRNWEEISVGPMGATGATGPVGVYPYNNTSTNTVVSTSTRTYFINATSSNIQMVLPDPNTDGGGEYKFRRIDSSTYSVLLIHTMSGSNKIEYDESLLLGNETSYTLASNGSGWFLM